MRLLSEISKSYMPKIEDAKLVHAVQHLFHMEYLKTPIMSSEVVCPMCSEKNGHTCLIDPATSKHRLWFCSNAVCLTAVLKSKKGQYIPTNKQQRSLEWLKFCELNNIGDCEHLVKFESINQSDGKIDYLSGFAQKPKGIVLMQGSPGTGKTYAALGVCEFFTRNSASCLFFTQESLCNEWLDGFKSDKPSSLRDRANIVSLLVIDDFGTREPPAGFMQFFMDVINTRMQWTNRGTIITTNLEDSKFSQFCGEALSDRVKTGQMLQFVGETRRKPPIR